jgi:hypothetical protein
MFLVALLLATFLHGSAPAPAPVPYDTIGGPSKTCASPDVVCTP